MLDAAFEEFEDVTLATIALGSVMLEMTDSALGLGPTSVSTVSTDVGTMLAVPFPVAIAISAIVSCDCFLLQTEHPWFVTSDIKGRRPESGQGTAPQKVALFGSEISAKFDAVQKPM